MLIRNATAVWQGNLLEGAGNMKFGGGAFEGQYSFKSRFEKGKGTNPEELIAAAHAGCFSMAFAAILAEKGFKPQNVETTANVHLDKVEGGFKITTIALNTEVQMPDIDEDKFQRLAEDAKKNCPVSRALAGVEIELKAKLV
jgi:osmotically inducible protein OsmC